MAPLVRKSLFRHIRPDTYQRAHHYVDTKVSQSSWDSNKLAVNTKFMALVWNISGGGAVGVIDVNKPGRLGASPALITGHKAAVNDVHFSPHNEHLLASCSDDATIKLWNIPEGGLTGNMTEAAVTLAGHTHKVGNIRFHPVASNILASSSQDQTMKIWDVQAVEQVKAIELGAYPTYFSWSPTGKTICIACKDKHQRLIDPRTEEIICKWQAHTGMKPVRVVYITEDRFITIGATRSASREMKMWSKEKLLAGETEPIAELEIDQGSSVLVPHFDADTGILYVGGKGDGNIRFYEIVDTKIHPISQFNSNEPQLTIEFAPKRSMDVMNAEIARVMKVCRSHIEPISFKVPRRVSGFHADLFPDCESGEPGLTGAAWLAGEDAEAPRMSMAPTDAPVEEKKVEEFVPEKTETHVETDAEKVVRLEAEVAALKKELAELKAQKPAEEAAQE